MFSHFMEDNCAYCGFIIKLVSALPTIYLFGSIRRPPAKQSEYVASEKGWHLRLLAFIYNALSNET
jgi:hypothetical protein